MLRVLSPLAFVVLAGAAFAQKTESDVRGVYKQMNALFAKRDGSGLVALFDRSTTSDFVSIMENKRMGRAKTMADIRANFKLKNFPSIETKVLSVRKAGRVLMVSVLWTVDGKGSDGKPYRLVSNSTDTWVQTAKGYRMKQTHEATPPHPVKL